ncbi:CBS domain-containing protein [Acidiphilium sp. AL]|uniref:CBS domain-containing protein n=1 Tax=Acidiphilium iwatense TaxID=768198 RepID=A0ABS9DZC9_9PROT|nr:MULTISPECIES: CBS domain-containing protein [Acidiphilium]MCF3946782.1 CBS domain-containing protein [Acidiphilium iwatense]MCU4158751.1 CBS domain-containing protein [Acidiphilium sp. AL]
MIVETMLRHRGPRIVSLSMDKTLQAAVTLMRAEQVDAVVVIDRCATEGEAVLGVLTRQDVTDAVADHGAAAFAMPVAKLIKGRLVVCDIGEELPTLIEMMRERAAQHALVMDREQAIGLIDVSDILFFGQGTAASGDARVH